MKIEWLVADVTAVRSPDRAERAILRMILTERNAIFGVVLEGRFFCQFRLYL